MKFRAILSATVAVAALSLAFTVPAFAEDGVEIDEPYVGIGDGTEIGPQSAKVTINADSVTGVTFPNGGRFQAVSGGWTETNDNNSTVFSYEVERRDQSTIFLYDRSRGTHIALDIARMTIWYAPDGSDYSALYQITGVH